MWLTSRRRNLQNDVLPVPYWLCVASTVEGDVLSVVYEHGQVYPVIVPVVPVFVVYDVPRKEFEVLRDHRTSKPHALTPWLMASSVLNVGKVALLVAIMLPASLDLAAHKVKVGPTEGTNGCNAAPFGRVNPGFLQPFTDTDSRQADNQADSSKAEVLIFIHTHKM